ncbi:MAG: hypothetical protein ACTHMK_04585 [Dyella sp.]|uniref:hypothetical protein n=1 Tax=Dyella sp. TaxID=1869338 RepID=UPI003F80CE0A
MQQFIPFEDDWAMAEAFAGHRLVPYQPGMACAQRVAPQEPGPNRIVQHEQQKLFAPSSQPRRSAL